MLITLQETEQCLYLQFLTVPPHTRHAPLMHSCNFLMASSRLGGGFFALGREVTKENLPHDICP